MTDQAPASPALTDERKITCHASGDHCHGCSHYQGKSDICEFAPPKLLTRPTPSERPVAQVREASSADWHQQRGRHFDIIQEAIATYDDWMLDDDYDATSKLHEIIKQMRERVALTSECPSEAQIEDEIVRLGSAIMDRRAERPSEAAVAWRGSDDAIRSLIAREIWRYQECPWDFDKPDGMQAELQKEIAVDQAEGIRKVIFESSVLKAGLAIPHGDAVAWTTEERHAIAHARHQVESFNLGAINDRNGRT